MRASLIILTIITFFNYNIFACEVYTQVHNYGGLEITGSIGIYNLWTVGPWMVYQMDENGDDVWSCNMVNKVDWNHLPNSGLVEITEDLRVGSVDVDIETTTLDVDVYIRADPFNWLPTTVRSLPKVYHEDCLEDNVTIDQEGWLTILCKRLNDYIRTINLFI